MATKTKTEIVDLVDHKELLLLFRDYVDQCIEDFTFSNKVRPLSFDEWYVRVFEPNKDEETTVVTFDLCWEEASGGYMSGSCGPESFKVRIPADMVAESGAIFDIDGFRRMAKKFANNKNRRLPTVLYRGKVAYKWSWD